MNFRADRVRQAVRDFDFPRLFVEELGWDNPPGPQSIPVDDRSYHLEAVAEKSGLVAYVHRAPDLPPRAERMKIERKLARQVHEHLLVFTDDAQTRQVWQWVRRQAGQTPRYREHTYRRGQTGELLVQKLQPLAFSLDDDPSIADVTGRARKAFDVDRVTRRFYDKFKSEHQAFQGFLQGVIPIEKDREVYTSVMLDRLMFVYFIQKKGFLDDDPDYLRTKLKQVQRLRGQGRFLSFYRQFLRRFFHEGLGQPKIDPDPDLIALIGQVPYLNGGIFDVHELERRYPDIQVDDLAFVKLFDFFDRYDWRLDDRPLRADNEINPDVLGYIFEKHINQKLMGAYYTKEDITGYIARNTVIPRLFDMARKDCAIAFRPDSALWQLLSEDPDRYIYPPVREGVDRPLPAEVAAGLDDVSRRGRWNEPADDAHALPTETWREHVARRRRYEDVWEKLVEGEVNRIDDLITLNLDIRRFAQDAILDCEGPDLLRAFWKAIRSVSVLDPACGSGAFLFAALNVLEPLYDACLRGMQAFVNDVDRPGVKHNRAKLSDFRRYLAEVAKHPNRRYYILKSIVIGNLYGVDIMEEAVDICKLRLFLKLVAQVDTVAELEPLPDIDFNIRAGNSLVGFTSLEAVERAMTIEPDGQRRQVFPEDRAVLEGINERARLAATAFARFQQMQTAHDLPAADFHQAKADLRTRLHSLERELDGYLAIEYGLDRNEQTSLAEWQQSHQPFHWFVEFYGVMTRGGFDIVIGNPPYVESRKVSDYIVRGFETESCGDLYAYMLDRAIEISARPSWIGYIVPLSCFSVQRFNTLQQLCYNNTESLFISHWSGDAHPSKMFEGVNKRLQIVIARCSRKKTDKYICSSRYLKWYSGERPILFGTFPHYQSINGLDRVSFFPSSIPKIQSELELSIISKLHSCEKTIHSLTSKTGNHFMYYTRKVSFFLQFLSFIPEVRDEYGQSRSPSELKVLNFNNKTRRDLGLACLSSSLFYWYYIVNSDCRNLNNREVLSFPIPNYISSESRGDMNLLLSELMQSYIDHASFRTVKYKRIGKVTVQYFNFRPSKPIIDEVDRVLAKHYGFTDEELDFIINYDIKYRMGRGG